MQTPLRPGLRATRIGVLAVLVPVVAWSFANTIVKIVDVSATTFTFVRLWMGAAVMAAVLAIARRRLTGRMVSASAPAGVLFGLTLMLFFSAVKRTGVADVLVIGALQPALMLLVAGRLFGERHTGWELTWALISVAGVVVFVVGSSATPAWSLEGDLLALAALVAFSAYFLLSKRVRRDVQAIEFITIVTVVAALVVTPIGLAFGESPSVLRAPDWLWLALFVAAAQGGHLLLAWAHRQVDVTVSSLLILAEPPITAVAALLVLGEPITGLMIAGGFIAMAGIGSVVRGATKAGQAGPGSDLKPPEPPDEARPMVARRGARSRGPRDR
jgi:inner membrane transporter RhtA